MKPEDEITLQEKLEEEIAELKSRIKNTEYDLARMFRGNSMLEGKLSSSKQVLEEKQLALKQLQDNKPPKLQELEDNLVKGDSEPISSEQENMLDEEIEKGVV